MSHVLKNSFPRNITLERSDNGYSLISETDPHDYIEDAYLNIYDENQDLLIRSKNSNGGIVGGNFTQLTDYADDLKDFIKWNSSIPYNFTSNSIQATINPSLVPGSNSSDSITFIADTEDFFEEIEDKNDDERTTTIVLPLDRLKIQNTNEFIECGINLWVDNRDLYWIGEYYENKTYSLNMSTSEAPFFRIQSYYVRASSGIRIVSNGSCNCSLKLFVGDCSGFYEETDFYISDIEEMMFSDIKIEYKQTLYNLNMSLTSPWTKGTTQFFEWRAHKYGISKDSEYASGDPPTWEYTTTILKSTHNVIPVASLANFSQYFDPGSTVYWSIDTQSRNYDVFKASIFIELEQMTPPTETGTASYYVTSNGTGLETGDAIEGKYTIKLKEESKYYYEHKIAEVTKTTSDSNYQYTLSFKEQIPTISPKYYEVIINGESLEIDEASTSSIATKSTSIDLLGEGVSKAQVAIILYTPKTYFKLVDSSISSTTLLGKTMSVYSKILTGEINAFKIEEDISPIINVKYDTFSGEIIITEENSKFNLLWYNITVLSEDNTPIFKSSKIFSPLLEWKSNIPLKKGQQYRVQLEYQLRSGILKQETRSLKVTEDQFRTLTLPLNSGEEIPFESFIEIYRFKKVSEDSVSDLLNLNLEISSNDESKKTYKSTYYTVGDDKINKILTFYSNNTDAASYSERYSSYIETETEIIYKKNVEDLKTVVRIDENQKIHLLSQSLKKGRLKDHGLSLREKYQYSSPISNSVLELSMTWGQFITGRAIVYKNKLFIYDLQSSLSGSLLNKSFQIIAGELVIEENHFALDNLTFSTLSVNFEIPPVDYIPVCLYGNVEKDENYNIYQVDPENIWYFDLDTKAGSIDFINEHTAINTLDILPKVGISNMNYMTQTITTKLGHLNEEDIYVDDNGEKLNEFIDLMNNNSIKILRLGNGYLIPVDIQLKNNVSNTSVVDKPSDITFSWTQIGDHRNISLYEEVI